MPRGIPASGKRKPRTTGNLLEKRVELLELKMKNLEATRHMAPAKTVTYQCVDCGVQEKVEEGQPVTHEHGAHRMVATDHPAFDRIQTPGGFEQYQTEQAIAASRAQEVGRGQRDPHIPRTVLDEHGIEHDTSSGEVLHAAPILSTEPQDGGNPFDPTVRLRKRHAAMVQAKMEAQDSKKEFDEEKWSYEYGQKEQKEINALAKEKNVEQDKDGAPVVQKTAGEKGGGIPN